MQRLVAALAAAFLFLFAFATPALADHTEPVGGQFCAGDHTGNTQADDDGDYFICEERDDDTQPRWYPTDAPSVQDTDGSTTDESTQAAELPKTGRPRLRYLTAAAFALVVAGGLLMFTTRVRQSYSPR